MAVTRKTRAKKYAAAMSTIRTDTGKSDGWVNPTIGFGTARDKITAGYFLLPPALQPNELGALYYHNDLASRIVETRPKEALRRGYEVETATEDLGDEIRAYGKKFDLDAKVQEAWIWARLYGGSVILVGADDLQPPWRPLNRKNVRSIKFLNVLDSRFLYPVAHYQDPLQGNYGLPELYQIQTPEGAMSLVHESRLIRFEGTHVDRLKRRELNGWSYSVLQRVYDVLRSFETAFQAAGILLSDASQGVFKIDGLIDMIAGGEKDALVTRMQVTDMSRSAARSILVDAEKEDFVKIQTSFAGVPDMLERFMVRLAAAADMPMTLLMGTSPAGLNATGESDIRHFYDSIASDQESYLKPRMMSLYELVALAKDGPTKGTIPDDLEVCFAPMWEMSDTEQATLQKTISETDAIYIDRGVVAPEQVAIARFGKGQFSMATPAVDVDALQKSLDAETEIAVNLQEARLTDPELAPRVLPNHLTHTITPTPPTASTSTVQPTPEPNGKTSEAPSPETTSEKTSGE